MPNSSPQKRTQHKNGAIAAGLAGAAVGAAVGAAAAVVLSDKDKREQIKKSVDTLREKGMELQGQVSKRVGEVVKSAEKKVDDVREHLPGKVDKSTTTKNSSQSVVKK